MTALTAVPTRRMGVAEICAELAAGSERSLSRVGASIESIKALEAAGAPTAVVDWFIDHDMVALTHADLADLLGVEPGRPALSLVRGGAR